MNLPQRFAEVSARIATACRQCGREPESVRLIAASKGQSLPFIAEAAALGIQWFGENYATELFSKVAQIQHVRWAFIGTLQSNKIKKIVAAADEIHSLASLRHLRAINRAAQELGKTPYPVYIAVNIGSEPTKSGIIVSELPALLAAFAEEGEHLQLEGLMAIPPPLNEHSEGLYAELAKLAVGVGRGRLSLGMSHDLELAIRHGATSVRIGQALLGVRSEAYPAACKEFL